MISLNNEICVELGLDNKTKLDLLHIPEYKRRVLSRNRANFKKAMAARLEYLISLRNTTILETEIKNLEEWIYRENKNKIEDI